VLLVLLVVLVVLVGHEELTAPRTENSGVRRHHDDESSVRAEAHDRAMPERFVWA
jgi:hypothetical protein